MCVGGGRGNRFYSLLIYLLRPSSVPSEVTSACPTLLQIPNTLPQDTAAIPDPSSPISAAPAAIHAEMPPLAMERFRSRTHNSSWLLPHEAQTSCSSLVGSHNPSAPGLPNRYRLFRSVWAAGSALCQPRSQCPAFALRTPSGTLFPQPGQATQSLPPAVTALGPPWALLRQ